MPEKSQSNLLKTTTKDFFDKNKTRIIKELTNYLKYPSISNSTAPQHIDGVLGAAVYLADKFRTLGADVFYVEPAGNYLHIHKTNDETISTPYGTLLALLEYDKDLPWVLVYGHYDVQVVNTPQWQGQSPFKPYIKDQRVYARGASDNKGRLWAHIIAAEMAVQKKKLSLPPIKYNLAFLIEGEEERAGHTVYKAVDILYNELNIHPEFAIVSDMTWLDNSMPSVIYSLRGALMFEIFIRTASRTLHSGSYGNLVLNAGNLAGYLVYKLKDIIRNRLRIDRLHRLVRTPSDEEIRYLNEISPSWERIKRQASANVITYYRRKKNPFPPLALVGLRPSLDINGLKAGNITPNAASTIIPDEAYVKFSIRTVPFMKSPQTEQIVKDYINKSLKRFKGVEYSVKTIASAEYVYIDRESPIVQKTLDTMQIAFGKAYLVPGGATVPIVGYLSQKYKLPISMPALGAPQDNIHGAFESFSINRLWKGAFITLNLIT